MTEKNIVERMLPCPFCGGAAEIQSWHGGESGAFLIECENGEYHDEDGGCSVGPSVTGATPEQAARRWNRRSDTTIKELAGALGEARPIVARAYVSDRGRQHDGRVMRQIDALLSRLNLEGGNE